MSDVHVLAIDLAKRSFQICGTARGGAYVVFRRASFLHADKAWWQRPKVIQHLRAPQLELCDRLALHVGGMNREDLLGDIEADDTDLHGTAPF